MNITIEQARKVLEVVDAGLTRGMGSPEPGRMCVEAAVCFALGEPHSDEPSCVAKSVRRFKIRLNDSRWSSNTARTLGMRRLAIAQLGSNDIDEKAFVTELVKLTIQRVLPPILRRAGLDSEAARCEVEGSVVAAWAAKSAAGAAAAYDAADAAAYAAYAADKGAARAAGHAADADATCATAYASADATCAAAYTADAATYDAAAYAADAAALAAYTADAATADAYADKILNISSSCCLDALRKVSAPGIALLDELGI